MRTNISNQTLNKTNTKTHEMEHRTTTTDQSDIVKHLKQQNTTNINHQTLKQSQHKTNETEKNNKHRTNINKQT